ncbi:acid protease [Fomitiporia mediterranea MF3/22]|uniref:acid protease n=1 Tax=Fomitiporia mediterranea (strain MF3/22) TaxID=694068 RepID=UPI0004409800|nr:acid protease [Fomitiporia mediterranea MF3/22]EJC99086.1 acid protease [Fomitiporia mediterranea MF3/22]
MILYFLACFYALANFAATASPSADAALAPPVSSPRLLLQQREALIRRTGRVVHLDLERIERPRPRRRDEVEAGAHDKSSIGLGDALDITYNVLVQVGNISVPLVLDTGSADLWILSDSCTTCSVSPFPLYPSQGLERVADVKLRYGDSRTGTHATGVIGAEKVGVAGFIIDKQFFAAINDTNTTIQETGSVGICGLGFPVNSLLWNELYTMAAINSGSPANMRRTLPIVDTLSRPQTFPNAPLFPPLQNRAADEDITGGSSISGQVDILSSFNTYGPFVSRLILNNSSNHDGGTEDSSGFLASPQFSVTLQRTIPSLSGNVGMFTLGGLPDGVDNASLTWMPVRRYKKEQNGVFVPQAPDEVYPYAWDVPLDAIYFDGVRLNGSTLGDIRLEDVGQSALVDTGNSLIRGPADIILAILSILANSSSSTAPFLRSSQVAGSDYSEQEYSDFTENFDSFAYAYPCAEAHLLSFEFSGRQFPVDPRDFGRPMGDRDAYWCVPNIAPTDPPKVGNYLYSWSLGEPFVRGVLASFYYGNLTHPSFDPPRIGILSTVPEDTELRLAGAVQSAASVGGFPGMLVIQYIARQ